MSTAMFSVGLDVHKHSVTIAVFRDRDPEPMRVDRLPFDHDKLRRYFKRLCASRPEPATPQLSAAARSACTVGMLNSPRQRVVSLIDALLQLAGHFAGARGNSGQPSVAALGYATAIASTSRSHFLSYISVMMTVRVGLWSPRTSCRILLFVSAYSRDDRKIVTLMRLDIVI
jgi:hypothetical protein